MECKLCTFKHDDAKKFSNHLKSAHSLSSEQYTIDHLYGGNRPSCPLCAEPVRYVAFTFKRYCKFHAKEAMKEGGSVGGLAPAWNKNKTKTNDSRIATQAAKMTGTGNHFYGRHHSQETIEKLSLNRLLATTDVLKRLQERDPEFELLTPLGEYRSRQRQYLEFKCRKCGEVQSKTLQAFERGSRCYRCEPLGKSNWELSVFDYVKSLSPDAVSGVMNVISPKEIDVYVPSKKFGIECHGLYWHSEGSKPDVVDHKGVHLRKFQMATAAGVRLLQIFEDEWRDKRAICESMIKHRLGLSEHKCKTWSTKIVQLSVEQQRIFFNSTHISGYVPCKIAWGLVDRNGDIIAALSLRKPRHGAKYDSMLEVARFSTALCTNVPGGLSKLLKHAMSWCVSLGISKIMTYVDRRVGDGKGYTSSGFKLIGETAPDYWYTDNHLRYDRFKFRARDGKSERQITSEAKLSRIWGCGSLIMLRE